ncbi:MAG: PDZ domain-containing protein [Acidobacteria bacterium]|nr:PDZ domain-containing protein [Acidobacteriota bacterium]
MLSRIKFVIVISSTFLTALLVIGAVMGESSSADGAYRQLSVYTEVLSRIKSDYVEEPDIKLVTRGALQGLLESLDPYSSYLTADQYKEYEKRKSGQEGGLGLVLSKRFGYVLVLATVPGSPAAKAGLQVGDLVEAVDRQATRDLPLPLIQAMLNGKVGTSVTLVVRRTRRAEEPQEMTLARAAIAMPPVTSKLLADKVGYVEVRALAPGKAAEAAKAVRELVTQGAERLVLDLRHDAVGDLQEGIKLANVFIDSGPLASLEGQKFPRKDFQADPRQTVTNLPLVVITNRATAGAAELAAAAIVDRQRGQIVGEKTFGLGAEQKTIPMEDGAAIILSVAKYKRPSGKAIKDGGVNPTLQVSETESELSSEDDTTPAPPAEKPPQEDELLKKAIEVVKGAAVRAAA